MLWDHQIHLSRRAADILLKLHIVYLSIEMRVGKTLIALETAKLLSAKNVLFVTKKKAISSILNDYKTEGYTFKLTVTNYEQLHKFKPEYDLVVADESHGLGHYPKPNLCAQRLKDIVGHANLMLLSGTPTPESHSQIFHQFWISRYNPFNLESFYKWAHIYVNIKQKIINSQRFNDYDEAREEEIMRVLQPYFISYTQEQAGFRQQTIEEDVVNVSINPNIHKLVKIVLKDKYYKFKDGNELVCDTAVKLQQKIHQIYSGTIKLEDGSYKILDNSKAEFIKVNYSHRKIAIYYKFIAEGDILRQTFPNWTDNPEKFKADDSAVFLSQIQSGAMGINLASAELLIFYNIDFSFTNYWQSRNRIQSLSRATVPRVIWIFASEGIESKIYSTVLKKKDYTTYYFTKDFLNGERYSNKNNKVA